MLKNSPKIEKLPNVEGVWGDPKSKTSTKNPIFEEISTRSNFCKKFEDFSKKTLGGRTFGGILTILSQIVGGGVEIYL